MRGWLERIGHRRRSQLVLTLTLTVVTLPFVEILLGAKTGLYFDVITAHLPRYTASWENWHDGLSPNWWGSYFGGFNALGAGQSGAFYLPNAVFAWFDAVGAYRLWFFLHLWLMAAGWFVWSLRRWGSVFGAFVSGVGGVLNGYVVYHLLFMPYTASLALLPWIFLALDLVIERRERRFVVLLALLIGGMSFTGHPQMLWLTLIALGVLAAGQVLKRPVPWLAWCRVASSIVVGLAIGAIQLVPLLRFSRTSVRPTLDKVGAFEYSASPRHLLTLLFPDSLGGSNGGLWWQRAWTGGSLQHEVANYLGIALLALAVIGAIANRRNRFVLACGVLVVLGILTALGGSTPFGTVAYHVLPFANHFRAWARNELWVNLAVTIVAGAGAKQLRQEPRRCARQLAVTTLSVALVALLLPALPGLHNDLVGGSEGVVARFLPALFLAALAAATLALPRWKDVSTVVVGVLCALDLGLFAFTAPWRANSLPKQAADELFSASHPTFGEVFDAPNGLDRWVSDVPDASALWPKVLAFPTDSVNGYDPLIQADYSDTLGYMAYNGYFPSTTFWSGGWYPDVLRTTTLLASGYAATPSLSWTPYGTYDVYTLYRYTPRLAETYLVGAVRAGTLDDARAALSSTTTDLTQYAYIDTSTVDRSALTAFAAASFEGPSGTVQSGRMDDGGSGKWTVNADRASIFVASYAWLEGWHATVDGKSVPVARTNALVLGVPVPAGTHEVRLTFTPPGWTMGRNLSILGGLACVALLVSDSDRSRWRQVGRAARSKVRRRSP